MGNSEEKLLPEQLTLTMVMAELSPSGWSKKDQFNMLFQYIDRKQLPVWLRRVSFLAQKASDGLDDRQDGHNWSAAGETHLLQCPDQKLELHDFDVIGDSDMELVIRSVKLSDEEYWPLDETQQLVEPYRCDIEHA